MMLSHLLSRGPLSRPPVFGDVEQIKALKLLRQGDAEKEEKRAQGLKEYEVTVECSWEETITVWAEDEDEAEEKAKCECEGEDPEYRCRVKEIPND